MEVPSISTPMAIGVSSVELMLVVVKAEEVRWLVKPASFPESLE